MQYMLHPMSAARVNRLKCPFLQYIVIKLLQHPRFNLSTNNIILACVGFGFYWHANHGRQSRFHFWIQTNALFCFERSNKSALVRLTFSSEQTSSESISRDVWPLILIKEPIVCHYRLIPLKTKYARVPMNVITYLLCFDGFSSGFSGFLCSKIFMEWGAKVG